MGCGQSKTTENKDVLKKQEENKEAQKNQNKPVENNTTKKESEKKVGEDNNNENKVESNKASGEDVNHGSSNKDVNKDIDNAQEGRQGEDEEDPNMKNIIDNAKLIEEEDDSVEEQDVELPTPLVVFGIFPPQVNKFQVLQEPLKLKGFHAVSTGSLLREFIEKGGDEAEKVKSHMDRKENVPGELMTKLLLEYIETKQKEEGVNKFFVSGFPRCEDNSRYWKSHNEGKAKVLALIYLSYTRNEYYKELQEAGSKTDFTTMNERYNYFLLNTRNVFDDFGLKRVLKLSATLPDETIQTKVFKSGLFKKLGE